jgi:hypothetical protein
MRQPSAATVPFATRAFVGLATIRMAAKLGRSLPVLANVMHSGVRPRGLAAAAANAKHDEHERRGHCYQENRREAHGSRLSSD